jgi:hypothetical protein
MDSMAPQVDPVTGIRTWTISGPYQRGDNALRVLLPDRFSPGMRHRVLYILPVEGGIGGAYGDGLIELLRNNTHNRHSLVCVAPAFDTCPWYGSHASDPAIRHEAHILQRVLPMVEEYCAVSRRPEDRLLFGFSKSGWGAVSLLLRNPDMFAAACSWDAPLTLTGADYGKVGTAIHFGSAEQMERHMPVALARERAAALRDGPPRLTILGRDLWGAETAGFHDLLTALDIPHRYDDGLCFQHHWDSGWVGPALERFLETG